MMFYELAIGAHFSFRGRRFIKQAMAVAEDEQRVGNVFLGHTEVTCEGEPLLLSPEEAARWKPAEWRIRATEFWRDGSTATGQEATSGPSISRSPLGVFPSPD